MLLLSFFNPSKPARSEQIKTPIDIHVMTKDIVPMS